MMKHCLETLFIVIFFCRVSDGLGQEKDPVVTDSMIYRFMNSVNVNNDSGIYHLLVTRDKTEKIDDWICFYLSSLNKMNLLTANDTLFIKRQYQSRYLFIWDSAKLSNQYKVINDQIIDTTFKYEPPIVEIYKSIDNNDSIGKYIFRGVDFKHKYGDGYSIYSIPVFSKDLKHVVIFCRVNCGPLCGSGIIYFFEYRNGKWRGVCNFMKYIE
jgi:hypothetical protein